MYLQYYVFFTFLEIHKVPIACMGDTPTTNTISCESGSQISILDLVFGVNRLDCPPSQCCFDSSVCEAPAWWLNANYLYQTRAECDGRRQCEVSQPGMINLTCHNLSVRESQYIKAKYICEKGKEHNVCCLLLLINLH